MPVTYLLESSIAGFLSAHTVATREQCDALAESLLGTKVSPVPIQGQFSYTVANSSQLVQFRTSESLLDIGVLQRARSIHDSLVPQTSYHGQIGQDKPLSVYIIEKLPGITYMEYHLTAGLHQTPGEAAYARQVTLIADFARFFAASYLAPQPLPANRHAELEQDLHLLAQALPSRFSASISELLTALPTALPAVLAHGDLCAMNILLDPSTGHLTGIIDWAEADVRPFGAALWGVETLLGWMDREGWHWLERSVELRREFWRRFWGAVSGVGGDTGEERKREVEVAGRVGVVLRYGFTWEGGVRRVVREGEPGVRYLDVLLPP